jgi:hypothetical protein
MLIRKTEWTSSNYFKGVGSIGYDSGNDNLDVKLVGTKIHGNRGSGMLVIDLVLSQLVIDDSNLMCALIYIERC